VTLWQEGDLLSPSNLNAKHTSATSTAGFSSNTLATESGTTVSLGTYALTGSGISLYAGTPPANGAPCVVVQDGGGGANASNGFLNLSFGVGGNDPSYVGIRGRGTFAAPQPVQTDDLLNGLDGGGIFAASVGSFSQSAGFILRASENWSANSRGAYATLYVTSSGSTIGAYTYRWDNNAYYPLTAGGASCGTASKPWASFIFQPGSGASSVRAPGVAFNSTNAVTTSTTVATLTGGSSGGTYVLKANSLANNGDTLRLVYNGEISASAGTVQLSVGSIAPLPATALSANGTFSETVWLTRADATHVFWTLSGAHFNASTAADLNRSAGSVVLDLTTDENILFQGAVASGTVTMHNAQVVFEGA
jgi:hypothetical protein